MTLFVKGDAYDAWWISILKLELFLFSVVKKGKAKFMQTQVPKINIGWK